MGIAKEWYQVDDIAHSIKNGHHVVPQDTRSIEFAEWLTHQYRLAMCKGFQLAAEQVDK